MSSIGFVYILLNPAMPGVYKVGATLRSPHERAKELSKGTGVPHDYYVAFYAEVDEPFAIEREIHAQFRAARVSPDREFFTAPLDDLIKSVTEVYSCYSKWESYDACWMRSEASVGQGRILQ